MMTMMRKRNSQRLSSSRKRPTGSSRGLPLLLMCATTCLFLLAGTVQAFSSSKVSLQRSQASTSFLVSRPQVQPPQHKHKQNNNNRNLQLSMFMGSESGLFGVGTPEVFTVLLVGYFVLGPSDLYKLVKEIGKFIQNIRTLGSDLTTTFESNMESQLQLQELRKAQQELNDAFSFRRSINVDAEEEAFSTTVETPRTGDQPLPVVVEEGAAVAATAAGTTRKKKFRRRVKKQPAENPADLSMPAVEGPAVGSTVDNNNNNNNNNNTTTAFASSDPFVQDTISSSSSTSQYTPEELAQIEADYDKYTLDLDDKDSSNQKPKPWYDEVDSSSSATTTTTSSSTDDASNSRFQQQMSGNWNAAILEKTDELSPMAKVMELLALLEQEKIASDQRLEEEFRQRAQNEQKMYQQQRQVLEQAVTEFQQQAFGTRDNSASSSSASSSSSSKNNSDSTTKSTTPTSVAK